MFDRRFAAVGPLALTLFAGSFTLASAQVTVELEAYPFVGGTFFLSDPPGQFLIQRQDASTLVVRDADFRHWWTFGMAAGVRIADDWGIEGMFSWVPTSLRAAGGLEAYGGEVDVNSMMYSGSVLYHFPEFASFRPFAGIGMGGETVSHDSHLAWERHTDLMGNVLIGANYLLRDNFGIRFEARDCITRFESHVVGVDNTAANDLMITAGLSYRTKLW